MFMSVQFNLDNNSSEYSSSQSRVKVTDLLNRLNEEKKIEKEKKYSSWSCCSICGDSFWNNFNNLSRKN